MAFCLNLSFVWKTFLFFVNSDLGCKLIFYWKLCFLSKHYIINFEKLYELNHTLHNLLKMRANKLNYPEAKKLFKFVLSFALMSDPMLIEYTCACICDFSAAQGSLEIKLIFSSEILPPSKMMPIDLLWIFLSLLSVFCSFKIKKSFNI